MKQGLVGLFVVAWVLVFHVAALGIEHNSIGTGGTERYSSTFSNNNADPIIDKFSLILGTILGYIIGMIGAFKRLIGIFLTSGRSRALATENLQTNKQEKSND